MSFAWRTLLQGQRPYNSRLFSSISTITMFRGTGGGAMWLRSWKRKSTRSDSTRSSTNCGAMRFSARKHPVLRTPNTVMAFILVKGFMLVQS